jgi:Caspase domain
VVRRYFPSSAVAAIFAIVVILLATDSGCFAATDRVALVIGNGAYQKVPQLPNPPRDADSVAQALNRLGFSVIRANDSNLAGMNKALSDFGARTGGAGIAVVFYAGHGIEVGGENWLIPTDAAIDSNADAQNRAISLRAVSQQAAKAKTLGLVILDACRDNPFRIQQPATAEADAAGAAQPGTQLISKGLAPTDPVGNVLLAFAARDGTVADDGDGLHSPFTTALLRHIEDPGVEVTFLFRIVRDEVMAATGGRQQPYLYGSLPKESIYLRPPSSDQLFATMPTIAPPQSPANTLFTSADETRVTEMSGKIHISPPLFRMEVINPDVPPSLKRFIGVWISKIGMNGGKGRQAMLIVTHVDAAGAATGFRAWGPPKKYSWNQNPAGSAAFKTIIRDDELDFTGGGLKETFKLLADGRLHYQSQWDQRFADTILYPIWTLASDGRKAQASEVKGAVKPGRP